MERKLAEFMDGRGTIADANGNVKFAGTMQEVIEHAAGIVKREHDDFMRTGISKYADEKRRERA